MLVGPSKKLCCNTVVFWKRRKLAKFHSALNSGERERENYVNVTSTFLEHVQMVDVDDDSTY